MRWIFMAAAAASFGCADVARADDFSITPRLWYLMDNLASGTLKGTNGANATFSFNSPPFTVPMAGASITYHSDDFLKNTSFTLTGLYGSDRKVLVTRGSNVITLPSGRQQLIFSEQNTPQHLKRVDLELTAQTRINDLLSWTVGLRYERARTDFIAIVTNTASNPFTGKVESRTTTSSQFDGGYDLFSARAGIAFVAPLNDSRKDLVYGNAMAFVGQRNNIDPKAAPQYGNATFIGPDITVGYSHRLSKKLSFDLRYRTQFFFPVAGLGDFGDPKVTHGPSVGITASF